MCILPEIMKFHFIYWTPFLCLPLVYGGYNNIRTLNFELVFEEFFQSTIFLCLNAAMNESFKNMFVATYKCIINCSMLPFISRFIYFSCCFVHAGV